MFYISLHKFTYILDWWTNKPLCKSTDEPERQVLSIEAQMFELREYAKKEGLNIVREFVESKTAKEPGREIFNEMIASIEKIFIHKYFSYLSKKIGL